MRALSRRWFAAITIAAATAASAGGNATGGVSFEKEVAPLLKRRCAICHITGNEPGLVSLVPGRAYDDIVGVASQQSELLRIKPGKPTESYLYRKVTGTHLEAGGEGEQMPLGLPPLSEEQLNLIHTWIEEGAKNN
jgi:mono/diheme cytochrome c family protein